MAGAVRSMVGSERPAKRQKVEQDVNASIDRTANSGWRRVMSFSSFDVTPFDVTPADSDHHPITDNAGQNRFGVSNLCWNNSFHHVGGSSELVH